MIAVAASVEFLPCAAAAVWAAAVGVASVPNIASEVLGAPSSVLLLPPDSPFRASSPRPPPARAPRRPASAARRLPRRARRLLGPSRRGGRPSPSRAARSRCCPSGRSAPLRSRGLFAAALRRARRPFLCPHGRGAGIRHRRHRAPRPP